ncbi:hypothetical protein BC832DRAFT_531174 [Gaertneriomyces semiglobifer]|nr:hypothetical protein BC832DRAFT_531174 [Gaertneriomyces semiglobifer]
MKQDIGDSAVLAEPILDYATQNIHAVPYSQVSRADRILYVEAALLKAVSILEKLKPILLTATVDKSTNHDELAVNHIRCIIKTLDMAVLMTGLPRHRDLVMRILDGMSSLMELYRPLPANAHRPQLEANAPCSMPFIQHPVQSFPDPPSLLAFSRHVAEKNCPVLIKGAISCWPALSERPWCDLDYLCRIAGPERIIPVELGSKYTDNGWTQRLMRFDEFLTAYVLTDLATEPDERIGYLAQHDLFAQIPRLRQDIIVPDYCYVKDCESPDAPADVITNAWFGPKGTVSPLHHDPYDNLFAQVVGRKHFRLYHPDETSKLYPHMEGTMLSNTSEVDVEHPDLLKYPLFASAQCVECIVEPGDLLYIPRGWWHHVRSLSISFSVSFWY